MSRSYTRTQTDLERLIAWLSMLHNRRQDRNWWHEREDNGIFHADEEFGNRETE